MTGIGGASLFSIRLGQKKNHEAGRILGNTFIFQIILGSIYCATSLLWLPQIIKFSGASESVLPHAVAYMSFMTFGAAFDITGYGLSHFIRASGHPMKFMLVGVAGTGSNIFFDWLFMAKMNMGTAGAGLGTMLGFMVAFAITMHHFTSKKVPIRLGLADMKPDMSIIANVFKYGLSPFAFHLSFVLNGYIMNSALLGNGGDGALSAYAAASSIAMLCTMPAIGISKGMQSISGYNFGAKNFDRVRRVVKMGLAGMCGWGTACFAIIIFNDAALVGLFMRGTGNEGEWMNLALHILHTLLIPIPLMGILFATSGYFLSIGAYKRSLLLNMSRQLLFLLPLLLILPRKYGLDGVLYAIIASELSGVALAAVMLNHAFGRMKAVDRTDAPQ
jgi:putative MATE family efflux protein